MGWRKRDTMRGKGWLREFTSINTNNVYWGVGGVGGAIVFLGYRWGWGQGEGMNRGQRLNQNPRRQGQAFEKNTAAASRKGGNCRPGLEGRDDSGMHLALLTAPALQFTVVSQSPSSGST